ncbi:amidase domain-containing protein [Lactococcus cremoris]|uniref:amidase domain-containing protein n=2 Tax=Lactococcus lactis subsp. cremoris TaxID=1359 RepID=UPI00290F30CC|nr:amidase domain-containing protein [Lactococcus cremoris]MDU8931474.1 N-acetylmuramoyl-L-alanine amidase domain-containing protein [Lactococcus cremoris]
MVNTQVKRVKKQKFIAGTALLLGMATFGMVGKADDLSSSNTNGGVDNSKVDNDNQESVKTSTEGVSSTTENANTVPESKVTSTVDSESAPSKTISAGTQSNISGTSDGSDSLPKTETSDSSSKPSTSNSSSKPSTSNSSSKPSTSNSSSKPSTSDSSSKPSTSDSSSKPSTSNSSSKPNTSNSSSNNNSATKPSTTTQAPPVAPSTTAPSNYYQNSSYNQTSTAAQIPNSSSDSAASVYSGPVLKKIEAAKPIEKIDSSSTEAFIKSIADRVRILAGKNNLYASIILAQAILESGSGQSNMTQQYFNIFNITGAYLGKSISFKTEEFSGNNPYYIEQSFRVYSNYDQALDDYINLMIKGTTWNSEIYAGAWKSHAKTYQEAAQALQGIFATDPEYAQKLIEIIEEYNLNFYDNVDSTTQVLDSNIPESPLVASKLDSSTYPDYNGVEYPGADSYAFGNCTQYVYNRIIQLGGQIGTHMGNGGEWGINAQAQGYFTTTVPTEGYAVSFPPGVAGSSSEYGHVAFVEKVYPDNSILVSEMNVKGNNIVSERHISAGVAALATYIQPK